MPRISRITHLLRRGSKEGAAILRISFHRSVTDKRPRISLAARNFESMKESMFGIAMVFSKDVRIALEMLAVSDVEY